VPVPSLARRYPAKCVGVLALLALAMAAFVVGISRPFSAVTKFWIFEEDVSVLSSLRSLRASKEWFLFWVILVFTLVFPTVKMTALAVLWLKGGLDRRRLVLLHRFVEHLGKWSMLDVFIVALLVVYIKSDALVDMTMKDGLIVFTASVLLTQAAGIWTGRVAARELEGPPPEPAPPPAEPQRAE